MGEVNVAQLSKSLSEFGNLSKDVVSVTQNLKITVDTFGKENARSLKTMMDVSKVLGVNIDNLRGIIETLVKNTENNIQNNSNTKTTNIDNPQIVSESIDNLSKRISVSFSNLSKQIEEESKIRKQQVINNIPNQVNNTSSNVVPPVISPILPQNQQNIPNQVIIENSENEKTWLQKLYEKYWGEKSVLNTQNNTKEIVTNMGDMIRFSQRELIKNAQGILYSNLGHTKYAGTGTQVQIKNFLQSLTDAIEKRNIDTGSTFDELPKEELLKLIRTNTELNESQKKYLENHFFDKEKNDKEKNPKEDVGLFRKLLALTPFLISLFSGMSLPTMIGTIVAGTFAVIFGGSYIKKIATAYLEESILGKVIGKLGTGFGGLGKNLLEKLITPSSIIPPVAGNPWETASKAPSAGSFAKSALNWGKTAGLTALGMGKVMITSLAPLIVPLVVGAAAVEGTYIATEVAKDKSDRNAQTEKNVSSVTSLAFELAKKAKTQEDFIKIDKLIKDNSQFQKSLDKGAGFFGGDTDIGEKASEQLLKFNEQLQKSSEKIIQKNLEKFNNPNKDVKESTEKIISATQNNSRVFEKGINTLDNTMNKVADLVETLKINNNSVINNQNNTSIDVSNNGYRPLRMSPTS